MNIPDFCYMRRGKHLEKLSPDQASLLASVDKRKNEKNHALLLFHGCSSSPAVFRELIPLLPPYDAIICPLLPGHGESIKHFSQIKAHDWLQFADAIYREVSREYQRVDVLGLSLGGLLACSLSERSTINHLYLLAPALALRINSKLMVKLAILLQSMGIKSLINRAGNMRSDVYSELGYRRLPLAVIIEILQLINSFSLVPHNIPTDLFLGKYDAVVDSKKVAASLSSQPSTTIHWLEESAHVLPLDNNFERIAEVITQNWTIKNSHTL
jgi:carboxylesterase